GQNASPHAHRVSTESMPAAGLNLATDIGIRDASGSQFPPMSDAVEFRGDRLGELGSHQAGEPSDGSRHTGEAGGEDLARSRTVATLWTTHPSRSAVVDTSGDRSDTHLTRGHAKHVPTPRTTTDPARTWRPASPSTCQ